jgi:hypothetical protein
MRILSSLKQILDDRRRYKQLIQFAQFFAAYTNQPDTIKEVVYEICEVINNPKTDSDDRASAAFTLKEALFGQNPL